MAPTVFSGLARPYTLTREAVPAVTDLGHTTPAQPAVSFTCSLAVTTRRSLIERFGGDGVDAVLIGECLEPAVLPAGVTVGFQCPLAWAGTPGTLTIVEILVDPLGEILDEIVGQAFHAVFRR